MTTTVQQSHGPLNTGSGPQIIFQQLLRDIGGLGGETSASRPPSQWSEEHFRWLRARFVPPPGFQRAREALESKRVVLLHGTPGSGRRTSAMMLLRRSVLASGSFTELLRTFDEPDPKPLEADLSLERGDRLLFDLSTTDTVGFLRCAPLLPPLFGAVTSARAFLVVVLPDTYTTHADLASLTVEHSRPLAARALVNHLRHAGFGSADLLQDQPAFEYVRTAPLRQVLALSDLMARIRQEDSSVGYDQCAARALAVIQNGRASAQALAAKVRTGPERVLLLSTAMLAGGSTDAIWNAAEILRRKVAYPPDTEHLLDRADFLEQLAGVGATADENHMVRFTDPVDEQVRAYFWDAYPKLRPLLAPWVFEVVEAIEAGTDREPPKEADLLVTRLAELLFRAGRVSTVDRLIRDWARAENRAFLRQARTLLEIGLAHERYAARFRAQMRQWAQNVTDPGFGAVLIGGCTRILVQSHPDQALTRLRHLARRPGLIGQTARGALAELVGSQHRLLRRLLQKIADSDYVPDADTFVSVADPYQLTDTANRIRPMAAEAAARIQLVGAWRAVLKVQPEGWTDRLDTWLHAGADAPKRAVLLGILGEAADDAGTRARLFAAAENWAAGRAWCRPTVETLLDQINTAQGISFVAAAREGTHS